MGLNTNTKDSRQRMSTAIAWCLGWGEQETPQYDKDVLQALRDRKPVPEAVSTLLQQAQQLQEIDRDYFPKDLQDLQKNYPTLWEQKTPIGLVYGGATKIKQYVFEAAKLPDIRGASALLDRINLVDLPAFFGAEEDAEYFPQCAAAKDYSQQVTEEWLKINFPNLSQALIPELIIYSTGGSILAFCPAAFVHELASAIEKRYTCETLTANSCAVGDTFRILEFRFGLLGDPIESTFWLEQYLQKQNNPIVQAYFDISRETKPENKFRNRKNFNELVAKLANQFSQRRNGNQSLGNRLPNRCYPPMFETHPYVRRDENDLRAAIWQAKTSPNQESGLPGDPWFSETLARKRLFGQLTKREFRNNELQWWQDTKLDWKPGTVESWVERFEQYLHDIPNKYYQGVPRQEVEEARSLREIASASTPSGFVAYIYADGNNMGGYIRQKIKTPEDYQRFSRDIFDATEKSVYKALELLQPCLYTPDAHSSRKKKEPVWIHSFEIVTIGGDDVLLIVPAHKALEIAKTIGDEFERILLEKSQGDYSLPKPIENLLAHRYSLGEVPLSKCQLSLSTGVLITADDTPIYYAEKLVSQLLKSAKKHAKDLKKDHKYYSGTVDFLILKAVTMISSNIKEFREQGLTKSKEGKPKLKLYASPYTLHELGGILETAKVLKEADFPRSQLYQVRCLLEQGKQTAMLNYRYFRVRLKQGQTELEQTFDEAWCQALSNNGNLAPWMSDRSSLYKNLLLLLLFETFSPEQIWLRYIILCLLRKHTYETIWRELVDLYPFIPEQTPQVVVAVKAET